MDLRRRSSAPKPALNKLHGRLAVAVLLDLCHEEDVHEVAQRWGVQQTVFKNGAITSPLGAIVSRGGKYVTDTC